ncbi:hypothetical protein GCM10028807_09760 [Spirosoma daeguense]
MEDTRKEERRNRLLAFFEDKKGYRRVAEEAGISTQGLYYIVKGRDVTLEILDRLFDHYGAGFPYDYILWGTKPHEPTVISSETPDKPEVANSDIQTLKLQHKVDLLGKENQMLKSENERLWRLALPESVQKELNFLRSSSQRHRLSKVEEEREQMEVYGLVRYPEKECVVIDFNSIINQAHNILNSHLPFQINQG